MRRTVRPLFFLLMIASLSVGWKQQAATGINGPFFKIYLADNLLLVSEYQYGIRLYDVTDHGTPYLKKYLPLDGNADMAVTGTTMYCDSFRDLLVYDIADPATPVLRTTLKDVFNNITSFVNRTAVDYSTGGASGCASAGCSNDRTVNVYAVDAGGSPGGTGGSMARFCINYNYLYCVDNTNLVVFDIVRPESPQFVARINIGWGVETIFPYQNYLFIGSRTHMYIYNANDVRKPVLVSEFQHSSACDPVVVEDTLAYITLKSGNSCGDATDAMRIVNVRDLLKPVQIGSTPAGMLNGPFGLTVDRRMAYVCDGVYGLKVINAQDPRNPQLIGQMGGPDLFDAIKQGSILFAVGPYGVFIYDVTNPASPSQVATIVNTAM